MSMILKSISTISLILCLVGAKAQQFDVFYLSVGNAHYIKDPSKVKTDSEPFADVSGARKSARYVEELFMQHGNGKGITLRSEANKLLTKNEVLKSLNGIVAMAKKSKAKNPLLVFYYCGHGVSEGISWNQFLVPGDFAEKPPNISTDPIAINLSELSDKLLYVGDITDMLAKTKLPYLCLIDACYEGAEEKFSSLEQVLEPTSLQNIKDITGILKYMNEYHDPNPVVFAAAPGGTVHVVDDPIAETGSGIGPLCRRLMILKKKLGDFGELSLMDLVVLLSDPQLDELTSKAISNCKFDDMSMKVLLK